MENVSVIGAGSMGSGIAHVFAQYGHQVSLVDIQEERLKTAMQAINRNFDRQISKGLSTEPEKEKALSNISTFNQLDDGVKNADLVIEAATENLAIKLDLFKKLDKACPGKTILASNTSSISITRLSSATHRPEKIIGMHFMNPVPIMKLVEVIRGFSTSEEVAYAIMDLSRKLNKEPVEVRDYPGFVANRILMPMINEAVYVLQEGVAGVEEIDKVMKLGMSHPMGPLQLADFIGLDVCLSILRVLYEGFGNPKYAPCPLLTNMVEAGHMGAKSGEGFYRYSKGSKELSVSTRFGNRSTGDPTETSPSPS